jgi:flagellar biogenesis protein FliO
MTRALTLMLAMLVAGRAAGAEPAAAAIPFKQDGGTTAASLQGGALGILALSALAIAAVYYLRKRLNLPFGRPASASRLLKILETQHLGPRATLSVVEFDGRRYLIAQSEQGVTCLVTAPDAQPLPLEARP